MPELIPRAVEELPAFAHASAVPEILEFAIDRPPVARPPGRRAGLILHIVVVGGHYARTLSRLSASASRSRSLPLHRDYGVNSSVNRLSWEGSRRGRVD